MKKKKSPAQEYLEKIRRLDVQIDCMLREKDQLRDMALRITPSMSGSGGSSGGGNQDKLGSAVARIMDKEKEIDQAVDDLINLKKEASALLYRMSDPDHTKVLHKKYIQYENFVIIAVEMNYTKRGVEYLHGRALQAFEKVLEDHRKRQAD